MTGRLEIPIEKYVDEYGIGVPAGLAIASVAAMYGIKDAINVGGGPYGFLGVMVLIGVSLSAMWLSGVAYAHVDVYELIESVTDDEN